MAIKGKKKATSRPGGARRRPAPPAVRPIVSTARPVPWHRSMPGQLTMILVALGVIGLVMWRVSEARSETAALQARQDVLRDFTAAAGDVVEAVHEPVRAMLGAAFNTANPEAIAALREDTKDWIEPLEVAGARAQALSPPGDLAPAAQILQQSFLLYISAAKTYALVPGEGDRQRQEQLIQRSTEQRDQAGRLMAAALGILDEARAEAEMDPGGIQAPAGMTPIIPSPAAPSAGQGEGQRADSNSNGGDQGSGKNNDAKGSNDG